MDASRRGILRMFGVTAAATAVPAAVLTANTATTANAQRAALAAARNPFALPFSPPAGMTYNWKRLFVTQDDPDMEHIVRLVVAGWKPVPMSRHCELLQKHGHHAVYCQSFASYWIEVGGMVLMEKPTADIAEPVACSPPFGMTGRDGPSGPAGTRHYIQGSNRKET